MPCVGGSAGAVASGLDLDPARGDLPRRGLCAVGAGAAALGGGGAGDGALGWGLLCSMTLGCWRRSWPMAAAGSPPIVFPVALLANPADAFRLFNLSAIAGHGGGIGRWWRLQTPSRCGNRASVVLWPLAALGLATAAFPKGNAMKRALLPCAAARRLPRRGCAGRRPMRADAGVDRPLLPDEPVGHPGPKAQVHLEGVPRRPCSSARSRCHGLFSACPSKAAPRS